ncbi:WD40 repeat-like protein [Ascobolus immersus RN42]|uniref:WD40 repeat-like protein n=1 Tax=Ascobolus immersus RN42 TaxID=1160509 RepID=A0A3N4IKE9_ASCIM|nr:WD40 repeat-like protein [Ascobolus immersus RN42]
MSGYAPAQKPAGGENPVSGAQLNQIVIEYLNKKGYSRTEAMLRLESTSLDAEGRPIKSRLEDDPETMYEKAYSLLKDWVDNSMNIYQPQLRKLLFPIFVYSYIDLVKGAYVDGAKNFFELHSQEHMSIHGHDIQALQSVTLPAHIEENELCQTFLKKGNKYRINLTKAAKDLLLFWIEDNEAIGGSVINKVVNEHVTLNVIQGKSTNIEITDVGDNEGIIGHISGSSDLAISNTVRLKLGALPMDKEYIAEIEDELRAEDMKQRDDTRMEDLGVTTQPSLLDEFQQRIKREESESEDAPMRDDVPLPPYTGLDIAREVQMVKDNRAKFKLEGVPTPALPSIAMYTFHHTHNGLNTVEFSRDGRYVAGGFAESYVRIWDLTGKPLISAIAQENTHAASSRRLIGHSGPVYSCSFSPDSRSLLTASEDKSVRLWSLETYTNLVVYKGHNAPVWDVAFGPYGHYFATASYDGTARLWSVEQIYPLRSFVGHQSDVDCVTFHPNSAYVFTGSSDKTARMWDIQRGASVRLFTGHTAPITAIAASPDGKYLATAAEDHTILLWDLAAGKRIKTMRGHGKTSIWSLAFSQESSILVSGGADLSVRVWNVKGGSGNPIVTEGEGAQANGGDGGSKLGDSGTVNSVGARSRKGGEKVVATPDHLAVYYTKRTPIYKVHFTPRNLVMAAGAFLP